MKFHEVAQPRPRRHRPRRHRPRRHRPRRHRPRRHRPRPVTVGGESGGGGSGGRASGGGLWEGGGSGVVPGSPGPEPEPPGATSPGSGFRPSACEPSRPTRAEFVEETLIRRRRRYRLGRRQRGRRRPLGFRGGSVGDRDPRVRLRPATSSRPHRDGAQGEGQGRGGRDGARGSAEPVPTCRDPDNAPHAIAPETAVSSAKIRASASVARSWKGHRVAVGRGLSARASVLSNLPRRSCSRAVECGQAMPP